MRTSLSPAPPVPRGRAATVGRWFGRVGDDTDRREVTQRSLACAVAIPVAFVIADRVIGDPQVTLFAVFGGFAVLLNTRFHGPTRVQIGGYVALAATGCLTISAGTVLAQPIWVAGATMLVASAAVLVAATRSDWAAGAKRALMVTLVLPLTVHADPSVIPQRLLGWVVAFATCAPFAVLLARRGHPGRSAPHQPDTTVAWRDGVRAAAALALAVVAADLARLEHSFWIVLATLAAIGSTAVGTVQSAGRAALGTVLGFAAAVLVLMLGTGGVLWLVFPFVVFLAAYAPGAISFVGGQAAFTLMIVILFNLLHPIGWRVGVVRVEDVLLGCAVAVIVAALLWPRTRHPDPDEMIGPR